MDINFEAVLEPGFQRELAEAIVTMVAAVVSDTTAPDSAIRALEKKRQDLSSPEQRLAAATLQAYGVRSAAAVLTVALEPQAAARAAELQQALEAVADDTAQALLDAVPEAGREFKSAMSLAIAAKCAQLIASEIERVKTGRVTILNEEDARVFESQHAQHQQQRTDAAIDFLSGLPVRFPAFGAELFLAIRRDVQRQIEESHKRPDIHAAVAALFDDAVAAMPGDARGKVGQGKGS